MSQSAIGDFEAPPQSSRSAGVALATSIAAAITGSLLCYALLASAQGWERLLWSHAPGVLAFAVAGLWFAAAVAGVVCGIIALVLRQGDRARPVAALIISAVSLLAVPAIAVGAVIIWTSPHHPSDEALVRDIQQHEPSFTQAVADLGTGGHLDRSGLRGVGVKVQAVGRSGDAVLLCVSSYGIAPSGSEKGYAYSEGLLHPVTDGDLEHYGAAMPDEIVYRHISGPWYIYYQSW